MHRVTAHIWRNNNSGGGNTPPLKIIKTMTYEEIFTAYKEIKKQYPNIVSRLLEKASRESDSERQTLYGDLHDWLRDLYGTQYDSSAREIIVRNLISDYVIYNPECLTKSYLVVQESNVDGEILVNVVPCASLEIAKRVLRDEKNTILKESHHFSNLSEDDMEYIDMEETDTSFYINDNTDDYYEDIKIVERYIAL